MTIYQECVQELKAAGARVHDGYDVVIVRIGDRRFPFDRWRFNLFCARVHERTEHRCEAAAAT